MTKKLMGPLQPSALARGDEVLLNLMFPLGQKDPPFAPYYITSCIRKISGDFDIYLTDAQGAAKSITDVPHNSEWFVQRSGAFVGPLGPSKAVDLSHYPHNCPRCNGPAYIGAMNSIDCAKGCF